VFLALAAGLLAEPVSSGSSPDASLSSPGCFGGGWAFQEQDLISLVSRRIIFSTHVPSAAADRGAEFRDLMRFAWAGQGPTFACSGTVLLSPQTGQVWTPFRGFG
jgi:hypothetical protein